MRIARSLIFIMLSMLHLSANAGFCLNDKGKMTLSDDQCATAKASQLLGASNDSQNNKLYQYIKEHNPAFKLTLNSQVVAKMQGREAWEKAKTDFGVVDVEKYELAFDELSRADSGRKNVGSVSLFVRKFESKQFLDKYWSNYNFKADEFEITETVAKQHKANVVNGVKMSGLYVKSGDLILEFVGVAIMGDPQESLEKIYKAL